MSRRFNGSIKRSERLTKDVLNLINKIEELEEANRKLRANAVTYQMREEARERVLQSIQNDQASS